MNNNYFIFNENKCVGCEACVVACVLENGVQYPEKWRSIFRFNKDKIPGIPLFNMSLACNHCEDAPCMEGCPSLAYSMDSQTGAILIDSELCIGCRYCTWNCPYEAPKFNPVTSIVEKCNFCNSRLLEIKKPSCAVSCPTGALDFSFDEIDKKDINPKIEVPDNPSPSIVIQELYNKVGPEIDDELFTNTDFEQGLPSSGITAAKELPLLIFTFVISCMTAISASNILSGFNLGIRISFLLIGALAAVISVLHLGKKERFWRSILNIRHSWLSREILFFSLYFGLSTVDLLIIKLPKTAIVLAGLGLLLSIDMLYKPLQWNWKTQWHSGQVLLISMTFFMLINQFYTILLIMLIIRLGLTILMYSKSKMDIIPIFWILFMLKTGLLIYNGFEIWLIIIVYAIGEIAARITFYNDLSIHPIDFRTKNSKKKVL